MGTASFFQRFRRELVALAAAVVVVGAFGPWVTVSADNLGGFVGLFTDLVPEEIVQFVPEVALNAFDIGRGLFLVALAAAAVAVELFWEPRVPSWKYLAILAPFALALLLTLSARSAVSSLVSPSLSQLEGMQANPEEMLTTALAAGMVRTGWGMTLAIAGALVGCAAMLGCLLRTPGGGARP